MTARSRVMIARDRQGKFAPTYRADMAVDLTGDVVDAMLSDFARAKERGVISADLSASVSFGDGCSVVDIDGLPDSRGYVPVREGEQACWVRSEERARLQEWADGFAAEHSCQVRVLNDTMRAQQQLIAATTAEEKEAAMVEMVRAFNRVSPSAAERSLGGCQA